MKMNEVEELKDLDNIEISLISRNYLQGTDKYILEKLDDVVEATNNFDKKEEFDNFDIDNLKEKIEDARYEIQEVFHFYNEILKGLDHYEDYVRKVENYYYFDDDDDDEDEIEE